MESDPKEFQIGERVMCHGKAGTIRQIPGHDEYLVMGDDGVKRIAYGRFLERIDRDRDPKSAKDVRLK